LASATVFAGSGFDARTRQRVLEFAIGGVICDHRMARADLACNLAESGRIAPRADRFNPVAPWVAFDQVERAGADRAGRAENCNPAHIRRRP
jgi:hypothetical protein